MITGTIKDASFIGDKSHRIVTGKIYGDRRGRFKDGESIVTGQVKAFGMAGCSVFMVRTLHNFYRVEVE